jgi:CO/xanthine dehydrogenase Mo-binding subunit
VVAERFGNPETSVQPDGVATVAELDLDAVMSTSRSPATRAAGAMGESVVGSTTLFAEKTLVPAARNAGVRGTPCS